ncbi:hypothetical protein QNI19_27955 [Cytophagaceae bacterium DM2B3-1]|uniref:Uncharacterized protein n=2 Tax=Xanthocytophaga TaxID=3078918 RepID=A0AAE3U988_9BACT|nr:MULTISPECIES: hypothetical protein [Xanthocytophaga]MDJ1471320.1 hypothetical protein [Xanthocytophaga flavus]MDJ1484814.1 hypothetical protein [Xanthocytophaga flavus]MDJ1496801.1 hypothetical protein [Xanthocytophaga flavus]MDJ1503750.1 hypothetical protein [Xanthocytophaga agilis]
MAVCNKVLDLYEVQEGYYACENQEQIADWLFQHPSLYKKILESSEQEANVLSLVTYEKGSFHVYFLVSEVVMGENCLWLLYVPNYLSKHFDLLCFAHQYTNMDITELFSDMSNQFTSLSAEKGHILPVSGCKHSIFTGFIYDTDSIFSKN